MAKVPPRNPKYSAVDLWPPGSKGNVDFPPAAFFPVYLGNFLCQQQDELVSRVQQYFAAKGLLARMVFVRSAQNDAFRNYQDRTKLYDCLVYFTRELDALDAVKYLHRDKYYGHRLNIFPGRTPDFILVSESVGYDIPSHMSHWPDDIIVEHIKRETYANTRSVKRLNSTQIILQFKTKYQREKALRRYRYCMPHSLDGQLILNQHFLEQDVIDEMWFRIATTPFMMMVPEQHVLDALYVGCKPKVPKDWQRKTLPPLSFYSNILSSHPPRVELQIAQATLQNFGVVCDFVAQLAHTPGVNLKQELKMFYQEVANRGVKRIKGFRRSLKKFKNQN